MILIVFYILFLYNRKILELFISIHVVNVPVTLKRCHQLRPVLALNCLSYVFLFVNYLKHILNCLLIFIVIVFLSVVNNFLNLFIKYIFSGLLLLKQLKLIINKIYLFSAKNQEILRSFKFDNTNIVRDTNSRSLMGIDFTFQNLGL